MPTKETPQLASLAPDQIMQLLGDQTSPPVHLWNPTKSGDSFMRINRNGAWFHREEPIKRPAMIALFSSILRREDDGRFALVTPYEKQYIAVEDAPFFAVDVQYDMSNTTPQLAFQLNTGALLIANKQHPIEARADGEDVKFYVEVRSGLHAALNRSTHFALVNLLLDQTPSGALRYADQLLTLPSIASMPAI